ncbi:hypothetical protein GCM10009589_31330 [Arthrobacter pascens]
MSGIRRLMPTTSGPPSGSCCNLRSRAVPAFPLAPVMAIRMSYPPWTRWILSGGAFAGFIGYRRMPVLSRAYRLGDIV